MLKSIIDKELKRQGKSFKWLVGEVGISNDGLKAGLENESIKLKDFKKMITVLNMPIENFFASGSIGQTMAGSYNTQAGKSIHISEHEPEYKKIEVEGLKKQVELLESQIIDKDKIIKLLSKD
jgi:hypothetical protein